jgi:hypothetical protein
MGAYYFLACLLPPLPSTLGEKLPVPFFELSRTMRRHIHPSDEGLLRAHLSPIDAANWEHLAQGRDIFLEGGALGREEMDARRGLPEFIERFREEEARGIRRPYPYDRLWELCYGTLLDWAQKAGSRYLMAYLPWEIALRNHLISLRLRGRSGDAAGHAVLPDTQSSDFTNLSSALDGQKNPLAAERHLDTERLKQVLHCQGSDPFSLDALLAYLSRAMIYSRWEKMQPPLDLDNFFSRGGVRG